MPNTTAPLLLGGILLFSQGCIRNGSCPAGDHVFEGAYEKISPAQAHIRRKESITLEVGMPDEVYVDGKPELRDLGRYHIKWAFVNIRNQRTTTWTGTTVVQSGKYNVVTAVDSGAAELNLVRTGSGSVGSVVFTPADTGTYILHVDYVLAGDGCRSFTGRPTLLSGDRHLSLINRSEGLSNDSLYLSGGYYFQVLP